MKNKILLSVFLWITVHFMACNPNPLGKGNTAPNFKLKNLNGKQIGLSDYRGKVVLLHFWTDFCKSCRAEFPKIQEYYSNLQGEDFEILAVNVGQPLTTSKKFQKDFETTFPMLADTEGVMNDLYAINNAFPTNYFIAPDGKIIRKIVGWIPEKQIEVFINQHKK